MRLQRKLAPDRFHESSESLGTLSARVNGIRRLLRAENNEADEDERETRFPLTVLEPSFSVVKSDHSGIEAEYLTRDDAGAWTKARDQTLLSLQKQNRLHTEPKPLGL